MELFGSITSPFVRHCRIALRQTEQSFDFKIVDYSTSAQDSPMKKMPYLKDGNLLLTDSSSILMHIRNNAGYTFPASVEDFELFTMANTIADTAVNLFLLEKEGVTPAQSSYMTRQTQRLASGFKALNDMVDTSKPMETDGQIRVVCLIDWILFRERYELSSYHNLISMLAHASANPIFTTTDPRRDN